MIVAVMAREIWTDERLDDLNKKVDVGFADTKAEMRAGFARVDQRFAETKAEAGERLDRLETRMDKQFSELNQRFDRMQVALLASAGAIIAALIGLIATQL
jgi:tetrahydromethanopterin S-methyltransferase subunit G